ncbi:hypothetical protein F511_32176 [Dorcoceras hygrometricum]|uniref:Uncharacterized protein n=1 Tax=Dorcoceras hygrometricum TaxID=472368 RepID=A0A2Z7ACF9_9LAMI|nr:hypothetical protein F511_32176 [Dorcoceras hygrometricum]
MGIDQLGFQSVQLGYLKILPIVTGTQGNGHRPAGVPVCPAWLPEDPANGQRRPKQHKSRKRIRVQPDEGILDLVMDRIGDNLPQSTEKSRILVIPVGARHKCQQAGGRIRIPDKSRSKQLRKSTAIYRRRVRMNNIYRGFTGENDEEYRVQNTLSVEHHLENATTELQIQCISHSITILTADHSTSKSEHPEITISVTKLNPKAD